MARLTGDFFDRDTVEVARDLLGKYLVRSLPGGPLVCRLTETEAYVGAVDKACHAYGGRRTPRTETLYAAPGTSYIYLIYGMHHCLNFVTEPEGVASAVLIRGAVPVYELTEIIENRYGVKGNSLTPYQQKNLMNGPGKLCRALALTRAENGLPPDNPLLSLWDSLPELGLPPAAPAAIQVGKRIGIDYAEEAVDFPWRFWTEEEKR